MSSQRLTEAGLPPDTDATDSPPLTLSPSPEPSADQAALINSELAKLGPGGTLVLGPGTYFLGSSLVMLPGQSIIGRGAAIVPLARMDALVSMGGSSTITGILFQDNNGFANTAIHLAGSSGSISRVLSDRFIGFPTAVRIDSGEFDIESSFFLANGTAVATSHTADGGTIADNYVLGGNGLDLAGALAPESLTKVVSNVLLPAMKGAFGIRATSGASVDISENVVDQVLSGPGITIQGDDASGATVDVTNNYVGANLDATAATNGIEVDGFSIVNIDSNTLVGWSRYDLDVGDVSGLNVDCNNLSSTNGAGNVRLTSVQSSTLVGNLLENKVNSLIETGSTRSTAIGNTFASLPIYTEFSTHTDNRGDISQDRAATVYQLDDSLSNTAQASFTQEPGQPASGSIPGSILDDSALVPYEALAPADNAAVINAALARLYPGDTLVLPSGTYGIAEPIQLNGRNLTGAGTTLVPIAMMGSAIVLTGGFSSVTGLELSNLGNFATAGITVDKPADNLPTSIRDNLIQGFSRAIDLQGDNFSVQGNSLVSNTTGVYLGEETLNGRIVNNTIVDGNGIDLEGGAQQPEGVDISGNTLCPGELGLYGVLIRSGLSVEVIGNTISNVVAGSGVVLDASKSPVAYTSVTGNFIGGSLSDVQTPNTGVKVMGNVTNTVIAQNRIVNWTGYAVQAAGANKLEVADNSFDSASSLGNVSLQDVSNATVLGNMLGSTADAVVSAGSTDVLETGNVSSAVIVQEDASSTPLDILQPDASNLVTTVTGLPSIGLITRADGLPVSVGDVLTSRELSGLAFTPTVGLSGQSSSFTYSVSDASGNISNGTMKLTILDPGLSVVDPNLKSAFTVTNDATNLAGGTDGTTYAGPLTYLQRQFIWSGMQDITAEADIPSAFIHGGAGDDTLKVTSGSNVLDGGGGSNILIGAMGVDGGVDTFFTDARGTGIVCNTLLNFHSGDYATLWGFDPDVSSWKWEGISGTAQYTGATLQANVHGAANVDATIVFAGLSVVQAEQLEVTTGNLDGNGYLMFHSQSRGST